MQKKSKVVKKYIEQDFLLNPIMDMIENEGLEELPGCCGVRVLADFPENDATEDIVDAANREQQRMEQDRKEDLIYYNESDYDIPKAVTVAEIKAELFVNAPVVIATTIPKQKYAMRALTVLGFSPIDSFIGRTKNRITLWVLKKGN